jgi:UPF0755 protein
MTIRSGGRPRAEDGSGTGTEPYRLADLGPPPWEPSSPRRRRTNGRGSGGVSSVLRFVVFLVVLAGLVLAALLTVLRPALAAAVGGWAGDNPTVWRIAAVADLVREYLAPELAAAASADPSEVEFEVVLGDTVESVGARLERAGLLTSLRAFRFAAFEADLADQLRAGTYRLRRNMTPVELVRGLVENRIVVRTIDVTFREGLRIEQMVAKLETIESGVDPAAFYELATHPPAALLADFPWLSLPDGASLEGYLYPATYRLRVDPDGPTSAEDLIRMMLTAFHDRVGEDRMRVPAELGLRFHEVVILASIVEREAVLDSERPLIAGVYLNRLARRPYLLNADPTVIYAVDTVALRQLPIADWKGYTFWTPIGRPLAEVELPADLAGYQTYRHGGLVPGPIVSPSVASIDAVLGADTAAGYLYFVAIPDGSGRHAFAKTLAQHEANLRKYGYR